MALNFNSHSTIHPGSTTPEGHRTGKSKTPPTLLGLPAEVLQSVFLEAGLLSGRNIDLTKPPLSPKPTELSLEEKEADELFLASGLPACGGPYDGLRDVRPRARMTRNLLLTCKLFYHRTVSMLCRHNHILITLQSRRDFDKITQLSTVWFERLERLTIELSGPSTLCTSCEKDYRHGTNRPLSLNVQDDELYIKKWNKLWNDTFQSRLPAMPQLSLQLVCRISDKETAYALLHPMLHPNRRLLTHCSIRLHRLPKEDNLRSLAAVTVLALTSHVSNNAYDERSFNFFDLPSEIRSAILGNAELISPSREVQWQDEQRHSSSDCAPRTSGPADESHLSSTFYDNLHCRIDDRSETAFPYSIAGYFCQTCTIAASSDPQYRCCKGCWKFPIDLILASHQMYQEAMEVFFRNNKMVVLPDREELCMSWSTLPKRLPISTFISRYMTADQTAWHNLRFLDIILPCIISASCCDAEGEQNNALQDWANSLSSIRDSLNLSQLTIQVTIARWYLAPDGSPIMQPRSFSESTYMACYARLLRPLSVLDGLARLYILLPRIDTGQAESLYGVRLTAEEIILRREQMESTLETMIMGETYDAKQAGKWFGTRSRWLSRWHEECYFWYLGD